MKKIRSSKKGFTLAELLIVVAIIGVLVGISIPIFTTQLEKSRESTDIANLRAAKAAVTAAYLDDETIVGKTFVYDAENGKLLDTSATGYSLPKAYGKGTAATGSSTNTYMDYTPSTVGAGNVIQVVVGQDATTKEPTFTYSWIAGATT